MYGELIKIEKEKTYVNQTKKYLIPFLKSYGSSISTFFFQIEKVAYGIHDIIAEKCGVKFEQGIFMLIRTRSKKNFGIILSQIRQKDFYFYDYTYDNLILNNYHMVVIKFPLKYSESFEYFLKGKYSKMLKDEADIEYFFTNDETKAVLKKDKRYKNIFKKKIQEEFRVSMYITDDLCNELDFPLSRKQEFFNYHLLN